MTGPPCRCHTRCTFTASGFAFVERSAGGVPPDLRDGMLQVGYKDTFGIFAGERVRVRMAPTIAGLYMYHCHNLEHEDGGMIRSCRPDRA